MESIIPRDLSSVLLGDAVQEILDTSKKDITNVSSNSLEHERSFRYSKVKSLTYQLGTLRNLYFKVMKM